MKDRDVSKNKPNMDPALKELIHTVLRDQTQIGKSLWHRIIICGKCELKNDS